MSKPTIDERLGSLSDLSAEQLADLETDIQTAFDQAEENGDLETMDSMIKALQTVVDAQPGESAETKTDTEITSETETEPEDAPEGDSTKGDAEAAEEVEEEAEVSGTPADAEVESNVETSETNDETGDEGTEPDVTPDAADAPPADVNEADNTEEEKLPMAASAEFQPPEDAQPVVASAATAIVAGADIQGFSAGSTFDSIKDVNVAFVNRLNSIKRSGRGGDGEQLSVATVVASIPEDRMLVPGDIHGNGEKIESVTGEQAIVASGGFCAPLAVKYDIFGLGSTVRPIRDGLPTFGATRGGIRYVAPPQLGDYVDAIGLWTAENDANPAVESGTGEIIPKPVLKVDCAEELTANTDAVTLQLEFGNLASRAYPELVQRHNQLALVEHARFAERNLLSQIAAASLATTSAFKLGAARDFLFAVGRAGAAYRNRHRVARTTPLRVVAPDWVLDAIREDLAQQLPGDATLATVDGIINSYLSARNVNITWHVDDTFPAQTAGALVNFPATIVWYIFAEGTFLFLDGGTLDLGVVRDSDLVGTNDYRTFVETFEGVAKVGIESIQVTTTTHVAGGTVGTVAVA